MSNIAIFDADGTLHESFSIFPLYEVFAIEGYIPESGSERVQEVYEQYTNKDIDYSTFVVDTLRVAADVLKGRELRTANSVAEVFFNSPEFKWFGYVEPLMGEISKSGIRSILLTAEPQFIATGISSALDFKNNYSSKFGVGKDGKFIGNVETALGSSQKGQITRQLVTETSTSLAFGDSEGDIGMLELVDTAVCVQPTEGLRRHAMIRGWKIIDEPDVHDLGLRFTQIGLEPK